MKKISSLVLGLALIASGASAEDKPLDKASLNMELRALNAEVQVLQLQFTAKQARAQEIAGLLKVMNEEEKKKEKKPEAKK